MTSIKWLTVAAALLGFTPPANADWEPLAGRTGRGIDLYYDTHTVSGKGDLRTMWTLSDYAAAQDHAGLRFSSTKELYEFNCADKANAWRTVAVTYHSARMGAGPNLMDEPSPRTRFHPLKPEHVSTDYWKIACAGRPLK